MTNEQAEEIIKQLDRIAGILDELVEIQILVNPSQLLPKSKSEESPPERLVRFCQGS